MYIPKTILLFIAIFITGCDLFAQVPGDANPKLEEFQLQTVKWKDAYNSGNAQNLLQLYTIDARYISSHVSGLELIGRDKVIANFQDGMKMGGHIDTIEVLSMNSSDELVTLLCKYQATNSGQTFTGRNLLVLKKVNGTWLISIHMTVV